MSEELVRRLRYAAKPHQSSPLERDTLLAQAADRIEALMAERDDARSGLRYIRQRYGALEGVGWDRVLPPTEGK